jgi:predicted Zn-dependent protease
MKQESPLRFLSQSDCQALMKRIADIAEGGGETFVRVRSTWTGNLRWARNRIVSSGDVRNNVISIHRRIRGAGATVTVNQIDEQHLANAVRRAEQLLVLQPEAPILPWDRPMAPQESYQKTEVWFDKTYALDASERVSAMQTSIQPVLEEKLIAAGYIQVSAEGRALMSTYGDSVYFSSTYAQYSTTIRNPYGTASGWAGVDWNDWARVNVQEISARALEKCKQSQNPVIIEPGRYTTILEPQAVCDLLAPLFQPGNHLPLDRQRTEIGRPPLTFTRRPDETRIGERVVDSRISVWSDPADPDLSIVPVSMAGEVYHPVKWIENGILTNLAYDREYAVTQLWKENGLPNSGSFRMSGGTASIDEMIENTARGILVTRFTQVQMVDVRTTLSTGYTRDGVWLIEKGKVSKAVMNFRFTDSSLRVLNDIEELGIPQRVFHPGRPVIVPAMKVRDFHFTSLSSAI